MVRAYESSFNCTLVVAPIGIFIVFSTFFFSLQLPVHVCTDRDTVRARICTERDTVRDPAPSCDHDVAALRAVTRLCCHLPLLPRWPLIKDPSALNTQTVTHHLVLLKKYPLFRRHLFLRFHAYAVLGLGFHRCSDGSCGCSLAQSRISRDDAS